jgi:hypothetical protein
MVYDLIGDILKEKLNIEMREGYYTMSKQERPMSPKKEKSVVSLKFITNNS